MGVFHESIYFWGEGEAHGVMVNGMGCEIVVS